MKPAGPVFDGAMAKRCAVIPIGHRQAEAMIRKHYLAKWPGVSVLILGLLHDKELVGVVVYSLPPKETERRYGGKTWELARLWISDEMPCNTESWLIARSVRHIKQHFPDVLHLVSYADPNAGHTGNIYKASNWQQDGRTDEGRKARVDYVADVTDLLGSRRKKFGRRAHAPTDAQTVDRVSKRRFIYQLSRTKQ